MAESTTVSSTVTGVTRIERGHYSATLLLPSVFLANKLHLYKPTPHVSYRRLIFYDATLLYDAHTEYIDYMTELNRDLPTSAFEPLPPLCADKESFVELSPSTTLVDLPLLGDDESSAFTKEGAISVKHNTPQVEYMEKVITWMDGGGESGNEGARE